MFYLKFLSHRLVEQFVIRHLADETSHFRAEVFLELRERRLGVLNCIVQSCSDKGQLVGYSAFRCKDSYNRDGMIDVWRCFSVFTTLVTMLLRRK